MIQILAGVGLFFLGVMVGAVFHRSVKGEASKNKRLEQKLSELQDNYAKYQADVSAHFMNTAQAVQTLNKSYKEVHEQLAKGARKLCSDEQAGDFLALTRELQQKPAIEVELDLEHFNPPMDYAPKSKGDGTLSETFGMTKVSEDQLNTTTFTDRGQ
jgi:uncharacterized membrane-anchored protein YhcB (DUF1043 family)